MNSLIHFFLGGTFFFDLVSLAVFEVFEVLVTLVLDFVAFLGSCK